MCKFSLPKNYSAPEGIKKGEEFTDVASFVIDGDEVKIVTIGQDKTPVGDKEDKGGKPKGAKDAIKEQLRSMGDKPGSASMEDTEGSEEEAASQEEAD
jgi:hypothetical protein